MDVQIGDWFWCCWSRTSDGFPVGQIWLCVQWLTLWPKVAHKIRDIWRRPTASGPSGIMMKVLTCMNIHNKNVESLAKQFKWFQFWCVGKQSLSNVGLYGIIAKKSQQWSEKVMAGTLLPVFRRTPQIHRSGLWAYNLWLTHLKCVQTMNFIMTMQLWNVLLYWVKQ